MPTEVVKYRIRTLYATAATLANANPVLLEGEPATESDTGVQKIGDGVTAYNDLPALSSGGGGSGSGDVVGPSSSVDGRAVVFSGTTGKLLRQAAAAPQLVGDAPTAHAASHGSAGSDPLTLAQSQVTGLGTALAGKEDAGVAAAAVAAHEGGADPHPQYLTQSEGDGRYRQSATALIDSDIPAGIARDSEVTAAIGAHEAAADPHPGYLTAAEGNAAYQPLDGDLTSIAALTTTSYGRSFLDRADAAAGRSHLGLGTLATQSGTFSGTSSGTNTGDQSITSSSDATSHTVTLSGSGGSLQLVEGSNVTLTTTGTAADAVVTIAATGGGGSLTVQDEGSTLSSSVSTINFTGAGVTATGTSTVTVNVPTGSGGNVSTSGTPVAGQAAEWATGTTIAGVAVTGTGSYVKGTAPTITLPNATGLPVSTGISGLGTGIAAALAVNTGSAGAPVLFGGAGGTPSSLTLTNATGLPLATGVTGILPTANGGTGVDNSTGGTANTFWARPNGATGAATYRAIVAADIPTLNQNTTGSAATLTTTRTIGGSNFNGSANVTSFPAPGAIGGTTPSTGVFTTLEARSATSLLLGTAGSAVGSVGFRNATSGTITLAPPTGALGTVTLTLPAITDTLVTLTATQTLTNKTLTSPTMTAPVLGTPASGTVTNCTGLPVAGVTGLPGTVVGTTEVQTLTNKTLGNLTETVFTVTDGASVDLDPANGPIQQWTLGANRTPTATNFTAGESMMLMVADGTAFAITWTTMGVVWVGGTAPTLATSGWTVLEFWRVGSTIYGARVGDVA